MKFRAFLASIFPRLVIAFLCAVIPLYGLGITMIRLGEESVKNEWIQSMNANTLFYMNTLETEKNHIENLLTEYTNNKDLTHLSVLSEIMSEYEWTEAVNRVEYGLHLIQSSSIYVKHVNAYVLSIGRTIPDDRSIRDVIDDDYEAVRPHPGIDYDHFFFKDGRLFMALPFPESSLEPTYMLSAEIDTNELMNTLRNLAGSGVGAALIGQSEPWILTSGNHSDSDIDLENTLRAFVQNRHESGQLQGNVTIKLNGVDQRVSWLYSPSLDAYLCMYVPQNLIIGRITFYRQLLWWLSFISFIIILVYSYNIYRMVHRPLLKIIRAYRRVREGQLEPVAVPKNQNEFHYLYTHFNMMIDRLRNLIHDNYEQKIRAKQAQIKQLQSQINPHFLYNTYYILYRLSQAEDLDNVGRFTRLLGKYFEFITRQADDTSPLKIEMEHTQTYIDIQSYRFSGRIQVDPIDLPPECEELMVPKLILQPIVENAFKYALERKKRDGRLSVGAERIGDRVEITVEDNGDALTDIDIERMNERLTEGSEQVESTGIINVHRRLQLMNGTDSGITLSRSDMGGLKVTLVLRDMSDLEGEEENT